VKLKIALVHKRLDLRGGTERVFYRTALGLRDRGHEVHLFFRKFCTAPPTGVLAHRLPGLSWPRTARLLSVGVFAPWIIRQYDCDVVMSFDRLLKQDLFRSGGGPHKVFIEKMKQHGGWSKRLWYGLSPYHRLALAIERRQVSSSGSRCIVAACQQIKREMIEAYGIDEKKIVVILNGVDHERFHPRRRHDSGQRVRRELGIEKDGRVVLFVGTGFRRKGLDRLLRLWQEPSLRNTYLLVVGNDSRLSSYQAVWERNPYVIFTGAKVNIEMYYAAADLLVLPSVQEAFGNVVLEGLAAGLPVITVPGVGALDKVEGDLRAGILENPDDPAELKLKISCLLDPVRWLSLSQQARRVAEQYSWNAYVEKLEATLFSLSAKFEPQTLTGRVPIATFSDTPRIR
jgi:UDP-glucose:(heptosyl)LPS alpha-1,3-glucosyltransferase